MPQRRSSPISPSEMEILLVFLVKFDKSALIYFDIFLDWFGELITGFQTSNLSIQPWITFRT